MYNQAAGVLTVKPSVCRLLLELNEVHTSDLIVRLFWHLHQRSRLVTLERESVAWLQS